MDGCVTAFACPKVIGPKWNRVSQARFGSGLQQEPVRCNTPGAKDQYVDGIRFTTAVDPTGFPTFALAGGDAETSFVPKVAGYAAAGSVTGVYDWNLGLDTCLNGDQQTEYFGLHAVLWSQVTSVSTTAGAVSLGSVMGLTSHYYAKDFGDIVGVGPHTPQDCCLEADKLKGKCGGKPPCTFQIGRAHV